MAKESNSESRDPKKMYVVKKKQKYKHVPARKIWQKCLFGHVCYAVCVRACVCEDEDEGHIYTYIIYMCVYIYEGEVAIYMYI